MMVGCYVCLPAYEWYIVLDGCFTQLFPLLLCCLVSAVDFMIEVITDMRLDSMIYAMMVPCSLCVMLC